MDEQELRKVREDAIAELLEMRPESIKIYHELRERKKSGKTQKGDATRLKAARDILLRTGGIPKD